jgi:hypothetical protein
LIASSSSPSSWMRLRLSIALDVHSYRYCVLYS